MDLMLNFLYYLTISFSPVFVYFVIFKATSKKIGEKYSWPDWYYVIKLWWAKSSVKRLQNEGTEIEETPQKMTGNIRDVLLIYGTDRDGNSVTLRLILRKKKISEASLCLRVKNGDTYQFPDDPQICKLQKRQWRTNGLNVEILEPFTRLRITFNGFLRCRDDLEHVQFSFIWNSAGRPLHFPRDHNTALLTDTIARETWRDGDWIELLGDERGYEQFGAMQGSLKLRNEEFYLNLPSWKKRYWGDITTLYRDFFLFGVADDGTLFTIGAKSYKGFTQLKYGTVLQNDSELRPIENNDIILTYIGENQVVPDLFSISFNTPTRSFKCVTHVKRIFETTNDEFRGWKTKIAIGECDLNNQQAHAIATFWYRNEGEKTIEISGTILKTKKTTDNLVVPLDDPVVPKLSGGKGSSLGLLATVPTSEFAVPPGFVVLTTAFRHQLEKKPELKRAISGLNQVASGRVLGNLAQTCEETVARFASEAIDETIAKMVLDRLPEEGRWAVRSSGVTEDSEDSSSAGQNSTFLGCARGEVLQAISSCWGSLFTFQSVEYRRQHGIEIQTEMAVVVQKMVPAETAGVLFTCHPTTGDTSRMLITANYGLGESVVSGKVDPDSITLTRSYDGQMSIENKHCGAKSEWMEITEDGTKIREAGPSGLCLTDEEIFQLGRVGLKIEALFGGPRDIEWAFSKGKLYVLQARPVTGLNSWTDHELLHEFDNPTLSQEICYAMANVGEVFRGATTPLTFTAVARSVEKSVNLIVSNEDDRYVRKWFPMVQQHVMMNVMNVTLRTVDKEINLTRKGMDLAVFGHVLDDENLHRNAVARFGNDHTLGKIKLLGATAKNLWGREKAMARTKSLSGMLQIPYLESDSCLDVYKKIEQSFAVLEDITFYHCWTSRSSVIYQIIAIQVLAEGTDDLTDELYFDIVLLLSSCTDVVSAGVPNSLEEIRNALERAGVRKQFLKIDPMQGQQWLSHNCPEGAKKFQEFLNCHGHRSFREFELKEPTWSMAPSSVIKTLQTISQSDNNFRQNKFLTIEDTIEGLKSPKKPLTKWILKYLVNKCRIAVATREQTKSEFVRGVGKFKIAYDHLAKRMVSEGIIPRKDLLYHLSRYELGVVIRDRNPGLVAKAMRRLRLYPRWEEMKFPEVMMGLPEEEKVETSIKTALKLTGTSACHGEVTARACVITNFENINQLQVGDILVTYSTDIGWSPYFPMLSGVVTELGGLISHGAVVAREYGLPCIVGAPGATKAFKTGDKLKLSGKNGTLELLVD